MWVSVWVIVVAANAKWQLVLPASLNFGQRFFLVATVGPGGLLGEKTQG